MGELLYSTKCTVMGPLLIPAEKLREMDGVIEAEWQRMKEAKQKKLEEDAEDLVKRGHYVTRDDQKTLTEEEKRARARTYLCQYSSYMSEERSIVVELCGDKKTRISSLAEALRDPAISDERPKALSVTLKSGEVEAEFEMEQAYGGGCQPASVPGEPPRQSRGLHIISTVAGFSETATLARDLV